MRIACLLSGGLDSPVAANEFLRHKKEIVLVHCAPAHAGSSTKIHELSQKLANVVNHSVTLCVIPFGDLQYEIIKIVPAETRMIIYRRMMMRLAEKICIQHNCTAIATGDSLGQVASQTLPNLKCIYSAIQLPVLTPLLGMDKTEITTISKKIGTYDISIQPYEDCCSYLVAKHPCTAAKLAIIEQQEQPLDTQKIITEAIKNSHVIVLQPDQD